MTFQITRDGTERRAVVTVGDKSVMEWFRSLAEAKEWAAETAERMHREMERQG